MIGQGRIEFFGRELFGAETVYHRSCDINFKTNHSLPLHHRFNGPNESKRQKVGRPVDNDKERALEKRQTTINSDTPCF